ncbi:polysaccharide deacetylase family protein [Parvularcula sp. LCG005]|uniref:polysaccharide deacetylase family protein n=1 Tax=Parvularcula sp. LCG005 TaxID=3078805 RepID=UPI002941D42D|nr:polysaccharide deacetylase family protein [Parvularcula sp. LCG005]WOI53814.1 polysaccharide deacetylase family protein [Parvularcula sp. LCG005]
MHRSALAVFLGVVLSACSGAAPTATTEPALPEKRLALSFDDAPMSDGPILTGDERTDALITTLADREAPPAVFFVTTQGLGRDNGRARIERYVDAGHLLANHSHSHQGASSTDPAIYIADIDEAERQLAGFGNRRAWYRFPFLDEGRPLERRDLYRSALAERGLTNGYVTMDTYDWYLNDKWRRALAAGQMVDEAALKSVYLDMLMASVEYYDELAAESLGESPAHIILLHANDLNAHFIGDFIDRVRSEGWTLVSPDEVYADPIATQTPQTLITNQGHVAALAIDGGRSPIGMTHLGIEEDQIDALIETRQVFGER